MRMFWSPTHLTSASHSCDVLWCLVNIYLMSLTWKLHPTFIALRSGSPVCSTGPPCCLLGPRVPTVGCLSIVPRRPRPGSQSPASCLTRTQFCQLWLWEASYRWMIWIVIKWRSHPQITFCSRLPVLPLAIIKTLRPWSHKCVLSWGVKIWDNICLTVSKRSLTSLFPQV